MNGATRRFALAGAVSAGTLGLAGLAYGAGRFGPRRHVYEVRIDPFLASLCSRAQGAALARAQDRRIVEGWVQLAQAGGAWLPFAEGGTGGLATDARDRPGDPDSGWSGLISPPDKFSEGPEMGAYINRAGLPTSRSEVAVAEAGGKVYVLGGYADGRVDQPLVEEYDPEKDAWRRRAPLPRGANHIAAAGLDGRLYAVGGFVRQNYEAIADVHVFDPAANRWTALAPLPRPLGSIAAVALDGRIHAVGGAGGRTNEDRDTVDAHYLYDPTANRWSEGPKLPQPREHLNLLTHGGKLYAVAGRIENFSQNMNTVYVLDPSKGETKWRSLPLMPTARSGTAAAVMRDKIFVFGGEQFGGTFSTAEVFDIRTERWKRLTSMPLGRHGFGAVAIRDVIFLPAGGPLNGGAAQTNAHQAFVYP